MVLTLICFSKFYGARYVLSEFIFIKEWKLVKFVYVNAVV